MASIPVWPRDTVDTPPVLIAIVGLLVSLSIALAAPLACWSRERARRRKFEEQFGKLHAKNTNGIPTHGYPSHGQDESLRENDQDLFDTQFGLPQQHPAFALSNSQHNHAQQQQQQHSHSQKPAKALDERASANIADLSIFHNEHLAAMKQMATERRMGKLLQPTSYSFPQTLKERNTDLLNSDKRSVVQSVATTSRLHSPANSKKKPFRSRMPWSHGRPIPRTETVQRSALMERQSQASEEGSQSHQSRSKNSLVPGQPLPGRGRPVSDAAGVFLDRHGIEGEADYYRQKYLSQRGGGSNNRVFSKRGRGRPPSLGGGSDVGSLMPSLNPDALTPQDAADANDPGRIPNPIQYGSYTHTTTSETMSHSRDISGILSAQFLNILDVAEPDFQYRRLLTLALPTTITAMADPLYRIVLVAIISHFCNDGENSMVAYLLVILFIRLTTEGISVAITDAESNMVQDVLLENGGGEIGFFKVGQTMQLAIFFQVVIGAPVLIMWFFIMENVVRGLVNNDEIAVIASNYTGVIIIDYIVRAMSRSFMLPFHLNGQGQFERNVDIGATIVTGAAITIVATTNDLSLTAIGWIQVIIGIAKAITKVAYVYFRGWFSPYRTGLLRFLACRQTTSMVNFLLQAFPLFLGSLLELGEWDVLVLFVGHLGGAEVATWAIMGVIWEIFSALTEGLGEAASVRISYFLLEGMPVEAKRLANKVAFLALVLVLGVTSIFLMAAPNIAFALSVDGRIQVLFIQLVGTAGLANVAMTFAQVYWSLAGAQGHFGLASAAILFCRWLIILPVASIFIYGFNFDLRAVACAVAIGYTIAAMFLAWGVFQRDWEQLAFSLREFDAMDYGMDGIAGFVDPIAEGLEGAADEDDDDDDAEDDDEEDTYDDDTDDDKESSDSSDPESAASLSSDTDNLEMIQVAGLSSPLDENRRNENNLV